MEGVPLHLSLEEIGQEMACVPGVMSVHDLHVWSVTSEKIMLSAHLSVTDMARWEGILAESRKLLRERFDIDHVTLQPEPAVQIISWMPRERG
jgi:cobalt-zinc-cadmium efflux system protein